MLHNADSHLMSLYIGILPVFCLVLSFGVGSDMDNLEMRASLNTVRDFVDPRYAVTPSRIIYSNNHAPLVDDERYVPVEIESLAFTASVERVAITQGHHSERVLDGGVWGEEMLVGDYWVEVCKYRV